MEWAEHRPGWMEATKRTSLCYCWGSSGPPFSALHALLQQENQTTCEAAGRALGELCKWRSLDGFGRNLAGIAQSSVGNLKAEVPKALGGPPRLVWCRRKRLGHPMPIPSAAGRCRRWRPGSVLFCSRWHGPMPMQCCGRGAWRTHPPVATTGRDALGSRVERHG